MERELTPDAPTVVRACVFDAYGTLLDLNGAVAPVAARLGDRASDLLRVWRAKQLEYTWLRSLMRRHADFATVTREALEYACAAVGADARPLQPLMMDAFFTLPAFADAAPLLRALRARGIRTAVLSNGTPAMLEGGLTAAGLRPLVDEVLSVEAVGVYKPSPAVYQLAIDALSCGPSSGGDADGPAEAGPLGPAFVGSASRRTIGDGPAVVGSAFRRTLGDIVFVTANGWDAAGASSAGLRVIWINRNAAPRERLADGPADEVATLLDVARVLGVSPL